MSKNNIRGVITLVLTLVFSFMCITKKITSDQFVPIFVSIITFYYTSTNKDVRKGDEH